MKKEQPKGFVSKDGSFIAIRCDVPDTWAVWFSRIDTKPVGIIELDSNGCLWWYVDDSRHGRLLWSVMNGVADLMKQIGKQNRLKVL